MSYLLDTHVVLWLLGDVSRLPTGVLDVLADPGVDLVVSAVSALEVATKVRVGKLDAQFLVESWPERVEDLRARSLDVSSRHALLAGAMTWAHRDPFDRLLVAQAVVENLVLVTNDAAIRDAAGVRLLTW